jgi:hypothetical protein
LPNCEIHPLSSVTACGQSDVRLRTFLRIFVYCRVFYVSGFCPQVLHVQENVQTFSKIGNWRLINSSWLTRKFTTCIWTCLRVANNCRRRFNFQTLLAHSTVRLHTTFRCFSRLFFCLREKFFVAENCCDCFNLGVTRANVSFVQLRMRKNHWARIQNFNFETSHLLKFDFSAK